MAKKEYANHMKRISNLFVLLGLVACSPATSVSSRTHAPSLKSGAESTPDVSVSRKGGEIPEEPSPLPPVDTPPAPSHWEYLSKRDFGIRMDPYGDGRFRKSRNGGLHSGIDYLMPVGTPLVAPCDGKYFASSDTSGYGKFVQIVCPVPDEFQGAAGQHVSLLYGHLDVLHLPTSASFDVAAAKSVKKGAGIGLSGRSGNASAPGILAHLHFEAVVRDSLTAALNEQHLKGDEKETGAMGAFVNNIKNKCLTPNQVRGDESIQLGNRIDPYLLFFCLSRNKPSLQNSPQNPREWLKWSQVYKAKEGVNMDVGLSP